MREKENDVFEGKIKKIKARKMELIERLKKIEDDLEKNITHKPKSLQHLIRKKEEIIDFLNQESKTKQKAQDLEMERLGRELIRRKLDLENIRRGVEDIKSAKHKL